MCKCVGGVKRLTRMLVNLGVKRHFWRFSKKVDIFWWNRQCLWQKNIKSRRIVLLEACRLNNLHNYIPILILTILIRSLIHQQPVADLCRYCAHNSRLWRARGSDGNSRSRSGVKGRAGAISGDNSWVADTGETGARLDHGLDY